MTAAWASSRRAAIASCADMRGTLAAGAARLEGIEPARNQLCAARLRHGDGARIDVCADEVAAMPQRSYRGRSASGEGVAHNVARFSARDEHSLEEFHGLLGWVRGFAQARHGPHVVQILA